MISLDEVRDACLAVEAYIELIAAQKMDIASLARPQ